MTWQLSAALKQEAFRLGFNMVGLIPAQPARRLDAYLRWLEREQHAQMDYMARPDRVARRRDLHVILPGVQTIVCVGLDYHTQPMPPAIAQDPSRGRISNYAWGVDYHEVMAPRLLALADWLQSQKPNEVQSKVYVDTGAILERDHAETAAFGFTGKNTMLIAPRRGSWFFLGELLTTLSLAYDEPAPMPSCGHCTRCLAACPTDAFPEPYVLDAGKCISYLTIELKGWIPRELRPFMSNWIYGCDICQNICPFNRFAPQTRERVFFADDWNEAAPPLLDILALDEVGFQRRFANSPILRIKRRRLLRNACVAAGNWGSETAVPHLTHLLTDPEPLIRGHAAWALHQIGTQAAQTAVSQAFTYEQNNEVKIEINNLIK